MITDRDKEAARRTVDSTAEMLMAGGVTPEIEGIVGYQILALLDASDAYMAIAGARFDAAARARIAEAAFAGALKLASARREIRERRAAEGGAQ